MKRNAKVVQILNLITTYKFYKGIYFNLTIGNLFILAFTLICIGCAPNIIIQLPVGEKIGVTVKQNYSNAPKANLDVYNKIQKVFESRGLEIVNDPCPNCQTHLSVTINGTALGNEYGVQWFWTTARITGNIQMTYQNQMMYDESFKGELNSPSSVRKIETKNNKYASAAVDPEFAPFEEVLQVSGLNGHLVKIADHFKTREVMQNRQRETPNNTERTPSTSSGALNGWKLEIGQKKTMTKLSPDTNNFVMVVYKVQITNLKDVDSTVNAGEIFIQETTNNEKFLLEAMSLDTPNPDISMLNSIGWSGSIGISISTGGGYKINKDTNGITSITITKNPSPLLLYFEIPKFANRNLKLYYGDSFVQLN